MTIKTVAQEKKNDSTLWDPPFFFEGGNAISGSMAIWSMAGYSNSGGRNPGYYLGRVTANKDGKKKFRWSEYPQSEFLGHH